MTVPVLSRRARRGLRCEPAPGRSWGWAVTWAAILLLALGGFSAGCAEGDEGADRSPAPAAMSESSTQTSSATSDGPRPTRVPEGIWVGDQLILTVTPAGATAEFECAAGRVEEPLSLDTGGRFDLPGTYADQPGGPVPSSSSAALPARYRGRLTDARHLVLTVVLPRSGTTQGPFELALGADDSLQRCG